MIEEIAAAYNEAIFDTDRDAALRIVHDALAQGVPPEDIVFKIVVPSIETMMKAASETLGKKTDIIRAIFREDRKYLLGLRTPCSGDFTGAAEKAAELVGLPLRWMDVPLDNLEAILQSMLDRKIGATYARDAFAAR